MPYVEDTYQLPQTLEIGEWDSFNPQTCELTRGTGEIVFDGTEDWGEGSSLNTLHVFTLQQSEFSDKHGEALIKAGELVCNLYTPNYSNDSGAIYITGSSGGGNKIVIADDNYTSIEAWKEHLRSLYAVGKPLQAVWARKTPNIHKFKNVPQYYTAWKNGTETIEGNANEEYGASPTVVTEYFKLTGV